MTEREQKEIFDSWLEQHKGILFKIIRAYAFTPHDQEDLFQEVCLKVWQSIPDFRGEAKPSTWIYRVALYAATVWVRGEKKRPPSDDLADIDHTLIIQDQSSNEQLDWLYEQIGQLDPVDRSICLLMLDGYSYKEIAAILGISQSNVGVKIHRIKEHLVRKSRETHQYGV
ncbi:MAG: RNA polymerase sigma factor [Chloroflexota bacterium]